MALARPIGYLRGVELKKPLDMIEEEANDDEMYNALFYNKIKEEQRNELLGLPKHKKTKTPAFGLMEQDKKSESESSDTPKPKKGNKSQNKKSATSPASVPSDSSLSMTSEY